MIEFDDKTQEIVVDKDRLQEWRNNGEVKNFYKINIHNPLVATIKQFFPQYTSAKIHMAMQIKCNKFFTSGEEFERVVEQFCLQKDVTALQKLLF